MNDVLVSGILVAAVLSGTWQAIVPECREFAGYKMLTRAGFACWLGLVVSLVASLIRSLP